MTSLKFVNSLRERISTLLCLSLVGAASMGLAVRSNAQTATGTASVQYTLTASGWITGPTSMTDDGGNYSSYSSPPPTITSTVHIGDAVTARHGKATISQIFWAVPYTGTCPPISYHTGVTAYGITGDSRQSAAADAKHNLLIAGGGTTAADVYIPIGPPSTGNDSNGDSYTGPGNGGTVTDTSVIYAAASEIGQAPPIPPGGGACSRKPASRRGKVGHGIRLPGGHSTL